MRRFPSRGFLKRILYFLLFSPILCYSQDLDSLASDSLNLVVDTVEVIPPSYYLGIYAEGGFSLEPSASAHNVMSFIGGGVQYNKWSIGFSIYDFQGSFDSFVIFPNVFSLKYRYGGPNFGYYFLMNRKLNASLNVSYLRGDMIWRDKEDGQDFFRDEFNMIKANLRIEFNGVRYLKPYIGIGYQRIGDLELTGLQSENFSGIQYVIGLRGGFFNQ